MLVGAGRGLGAASAQALAREGCSVALVARTRSSIEERAAECRKDGAPKAIAIVAGTPLSFLGQKLWSFRA